MKEFVSSACLVVGLVIYAVLVKAEHNSTGGALLLVSIFLSIAIYSAMDSKDG